MTKLCGITDDGQPDRPEDDLQLVCVREAHDEDPDDNVHWNDNGTIWTSDAAGEPVRTPDGGTEPVHITDPAPGP